jgi:hypothetical protein
MPNLDKASTPSLALDDKLLTVFNKLLPLIDNVSDGLRTIALLGTASTTWLFVWMFFILHWSLTASVIMAILVFIPTLILLRFWWSLTDLKDLPAVAEEILDDVSSEVRSTWQEVRSGKKQTLSFIGQARNLWEMKSLLGQLDEVFGQYLNIGLLLNPFTLLMAILSVLAVFVLLVLSFITVLTVII